MVIDILNTSVIVFTNTIVLLYGYFFLFVSVGYYLHYKRLRGFHFSLFTSLHFAVRACGAWVSDVAGPGRDGRGCPNCFTSEPQSNDRRLLLIILRLTSCLASERTAVLAYASSERVRLARACKPVP